MSTFDKVKQQAQQLAGKAKEATGRMTGNQRVENAGKRDRLEGEAKERGQDLKDRAEGTVQEARDKLRGQRGDDDQRGDRKQE
ncbi:CsbD family protein [Actinopolyspora mortivallis]|uniref:CsbD family protein n=1 Tax=Actinopolyspora mortivallis TaxID=33906 RepID=UPI00037CB6A4|nr:CsbD family protein [Actinopolyspora mortivallis]